MINKFSLSEFVPEKEIEALASYVHATWTGINLEEARTMATMGFSRGWDQQGLAHKYATVNGKQILILEQAMKREEFLEKKGVDYLDYAGDKLRRVLRAINELSFLIKPNQLDSAIHDLTNDVISSLGGHLKKARPLGWTSKAEKVIDPTAFEGHWYRTSCTYHFIEHTGCSYIKYCVEENHGGAGDANALWELMRGLSNHGRDLRKIHNEESLGKTVKALSLRKPLILGDAKVSLEYNDFINAAFQAGAKLDDDIDKALASIEWVGLPTNTLALADSLAP